ERERGYPFLVRGGFLGRGGPRRLVGGRSPVPDTQVRTAVGGVDRQGRDRPQVRPVTGRQPGLDPVEQLGQPDQVDAVPAAVVPPIMQWHGSALLVIILPEKPLN